MSDTKSQAAIDSVLREERVFPPPDEFSRHAHVPDRARYDALYQWSVDDPEGFWREMAGRLRWMTPFHRVGTVEDVANVIFFLASKEGSYIQAQSIALDGGWSKTKYLSHEARFGERATPSRGTDSSRG